MASSAELHARRQASVPRGIAHVTQVYAKAAYNAELWSEDGRRFIDFSAGIGVLNVGHRHPRVIAAVERQLDLLTHTCFHVAPYEEYIRLCERLNTLAPVMGPAKTMLATTGAEAVENAIKIARSFTNRPGVVSFSGAFHGRTLLAMGLTGKVVPYKKGFGPFPADIYSVPFPTPANGVTENMSLKALRDLFKYDVDPARVAAIIIEPVRGEGGFNIAPFSFLRELRELRNMFGILLVADGVQSGFARTGRLFALEHAGIKADIVTMAKGLAGGFPLSAITGRHDVMDAPIPGGLGGTYAGNPVSCAAANAVLDVIDDEKLCERATEIGLIVLDWLATLRKVGGWSSRLGDIRGLGAMCAVEVVKYSVDRSPAPEATTALVKNAIESGLIILPCGIHGNVIRFLIPLTASNDIIHEGLNIFAKCFEQTARDAA